MRYATFSVPSDSHPRLGVERDGRITELRALIGSRGQGQEAPPTLLDLIDGGPALWRRIATLADEAFHGNTAPESYELAKVHLYAPIPRPRKNVVCLGLNYQSHLEESARARGRQAKPPEAPVFFTKAVTAVNGPYDEIPWDREVTQEVDYEVELGMVIGRLGKNIARADALAHVFGYTVINDVSARDLQSRHMQWHKGKSLDGFCPMGPIVVTADEFGDPGNKRISLRVNGVVKQNSNTARMIFPLDLVIESLSRGATLEPGDIISTGTPEGVGLGRTPPEYLCDGDWVEAEVEGIGSLRNRLAAVAHKPSAGP